MRKSMLNRIVFLFLIVPFFLKAQSAKDTVVVVLKEKEKEIVYPQFKFKGLLQVRYLEAISDNVDVAGIQHTSDEATRSSFDVKRMRVSVAANLSEHTEVVVLVNLADFKSDPQNKVLENAYAKYTFNTYIAFTGGQFRPGFGIEETVPVDVIKSFDFSNQYYEFGKNGWTSFQIGASMTGAVDLGKIPVSYAISVLNGNGKNQAMDKDNGKQYTSRIVFGLSKGYNINLGLNGGVGKVFKNDVFAFGVDVTADFKLVDKLTFDTQFEIKQGTNHNLYFSLPIEDRTANVNDYQMRGFYFLPNFRYVINYKKLSSLEFSSRYEYFDTSFKINSNARRTYTPMISLEFGKAYTGRIGMGVEIDRYDKSIPNTAFCNKELFILQFQCRL
jgi:hypothetical protein